MEEDLDEFNPVTKPLHYNQNGIECIEAIEAMMCGIDKPHGYHAGNVLKYLWRFEYKNGLEDLQAMKEIQNGYVLQPLSSFIGAEPKKDIEKINWIHYVDSDLKNINFFRYANFMLNYTLPNEADKTMLLNAMKIGV